MTVDSDVLKLSAYKQGCIQNEVLQLYNSKNIPVYAAWLQVLLAYLDRAGYKIVKKDVI